MYANLLNSKILQVFIVVGVLSISLSDREISTQLGKFRSPEEWHIKGIRIKRRAVCNDRHFFLQFGWSLKESIFCGEVINDYIIN